MIDFTTLSKQCAPHVAPSTMQAVVKVESGFNPYSIGVVGGRLLRQPRNLEEALATANYLEAQNWNFSIGISQVNRQHLPSYQMTYKDAFDPCLNLKAGSSILQDCFQRAKKRFSDEQRALQASFSCYYSGNFKRGFLPEADGKSYVTKVLAHSSNVIPVIPDEKSSNKRIKPSLNSKAELKHASESLENTMVVEGKSLSRFEEDAIVF